MHHEPDGRPLSVGVVQLLAGFHALPGPDKLAFEEARLGLRDGAGTPGWVPVAVAAALLRRNRGHVHRLISRGELVACRDGRAVKVSLAACVVFVLRGLCDVLARRLSGWELLTACQIVRQAMGEAEAKALLDRDHARRRDKGATGGRG